MIRISFEVPDEHGPTLRSVVEELSNRIGTKIEENIYEFPIEHTLTKTACVIGALRGAVHPKVQKEDPDYVSLL